MAALAVSLSWGEPFVPQVSGFKMKLAQRRRLCLATCLAVHATADFTVPFRKSEPTMAAVRFAQRQSPHATDLDSSVSAGLVAGTVKGFTVGSGQYLWLIWQHISNCPQTLQADAKAHHYFPEPADNGTSSISGSCLWLFSSTWNYFFADVFRKHQMLQTALQVIVGILCAVFVVQMLWSISSQRQGRISESRIGLRAWKAVICIVLGALTSRFLCQFTLSRFCVRSSWTGLPYYTEGHVLCAASSVLGAIATCSSLSVAFARCHKLLQGRGSDVPLVQNKE